jgi:hypothetical protein
MRGSRSFNLCCLIRRDREAQLEKDRRKAEKGEEVRVRKEKQAVKLLKLQEAKRKEEQEKEERTGASCLHFVACHAFTNTFFLSLQSGEPLREHRRGRY